MAKKPFSKEFLINLNISNRTFMMDTFKYHHSMNLEVLAIMFSGYSVVISLSSIILQNILTIKELILLYLCLLLFLLIFYVPFYIHHHMSGQRAIKGAKKFNKQYQELYKKDNQESP